MNESNSIRYIFQLPTVQLEKPKVYVPPPLRNLSATSMHSRNVQFVGRSDRSNLSTAHFVVTDPDAAAAAAAATRGGPPVGIAKQSTGANDI